MLGVVAVLFLGGTADTFDEKLALVFVVLGLGMLGTSGVLLADEVRMMRQRARDAVVPSRPWSRADGRLLNGLTPQPGCCSRAVLFVLSSAAYVSPLMRGGPTSAGFRRPGAQGPTQV